MKKFLSLLLSMLLIISVCFVNSSALEFDNTVYSDLQNAEAETVVEVPVKIANNTGFMGFSIVISYDSAVVEPISVKAGDVLQGGMLNDSIGYSESGTVKIVFSSSENVTSDGTLFYISLQVTENVSDSVSLGVSFRQGDTFDENWNDVVFNCHDIMLEIVNPSSDPGNPDEDPDTPDDEETEIYAGESAISFDTEEVTVPVYIRNNKGIMGYKLKLSYDASSLRPISVNSSGINGYFDDNIGKYNDYFNVVWNSSSNYYEDGLLFEITFEVLKFESSTIDISYSSKDTFNENWDDVYLVCSNAKITFDDDYYTICLDDELKITTTEDKKRVFIKYVPEKSGVYYFYSDSNDDSTSCRLYDSEMNMLNSSGDIGEFWIEHYFVAGQTYYFECGYIDSYRTGTYYVCLKDSFESTHNGYYVTTVEPTCDEPGYDKYYCVRCDRYYNTNFTEPLGHSWNDNVCERCGLEIKTIRENEPLEYTTGMMLLRFIPEEDGRLYFYSMGCRSLAGSIYDESMEFLENDCYSGYLDNFKIAFDFEKGKIYYLEVNDMFGSETTPAPVIVSKTYKDFTVNYNSGAIIDFENKFIFGLAPGLNSWTVFNYISVSKSENYDIICEDYYIGTGSEYVFYDNDWNITEKYTVVLFGDVNGDGWYDGMDSLVVSCLANGMLTENDVSEAEYMAADCNHDGVIDNLDVDLLQQAGVLLTDVDQTKSEEELIATSSAYVEYLNLIDQTVETETTEVIEEEPVDPGYTFNFFDVILNLIKKIITVINSVMAFFK